MSAQKVRAVKESNKKEKGERDQKEDRRTEQEVTNSGTAPKFQNDNH